MTIPFHSHPRKQVQQDNGTNPPTGFECRHCGCRHFHVVYTRRAWGGRLLHRRTCRHCGRRMMSYENTVGRTPETPIQ